MRVGTPCVRRGPSSASTRTSSIPRGQKYSLIFDGWSSDDLPTPPLTCPPSHMRHIYVTQTVTTPAGGIIRPLDADKPKIAFHGAMMAIQNFGFFTMYWDIWGSTPHTEVCDTTRYARLCIHTSAGDEGGGRAG